MARLTRLQEQVLEDIAREAAIRMHAISLKRVTSTAAQRHHARELTELARGRSPAQIARMEARLDAADSAPAIAEVSA